MSKGSPRTATIVVCCLLIGMTIGYIIAPKKVIKVVDTVEVEVPVIGDTSSEFILQDIEDVKASIVGLTTLVYGAIGASLVAALAAIVSLMQITKTIS